MELTIKGHKVTLYGNIRRFIFRVYDKKGYVHFVVSTLGYANQHVFVWKDNQKNFNGEWKKLGD